MDNINETVCAFCDKQVAVSDVVEDATTGLNICATCVDIEYEQSQAA
jgi:hypothetical protein